LSFSSNDTGEDTWQAVQHSGANPFRMNITWKTVADQGNWRESAAWEHSYDPMVTVWKSGTGQTSTQQPRRIRAPQKYAEFLIATSSTIKNAQNAVRKASEPNDTKVLHGGLYQPGGTE